MTVPTDIGPGLHEFTATAVNNGVESESIRRQYHLQYPVQPAIDAHGDDTDCSDGITISGTSPGGTESINLYADGVHNTRSHHRLLMHKMVPGQLP